MKEKKSGKVYYHVVRGSKYIFSDERNKRRFLDVVAEMQRKGDWCIYAFCIMDEQAYFVIEATARDQIRAKMRQVEVMYVRLYHQIPELFCRVGAPFFWEAVTKELESSDEVAGYCRFIHRIPLEKGYVRRVGDYWWSSYVTYMGNYEWKIVDRRMLLSYFSPDEETARRKLQRYHKQCGQEYDGKSGGDMMEKLCFS